LAGVDLADHQKKTIPLAFLVTLVMTVVAVITGGINPLIFNQHGQVFAKKLSHHYWI